MLEYNMVFIYFDASSHNISPVVTIVLIPSSEEFTVDEDLQKNWNKSE